MSDIEILFCNKSSREKKEAKLSRIAGEKILRVSFYTHGVFLVLCCTEEAANKVFNHYNYCRTSKSTLDSSNTIWCVIVYEREKIKR